MGSQPETGLGHSNESTRSSPVDQSVTRALAFDFAEKNFHKDSREASKLFIKRKGIKYMWIDTWADSEAESLSCALMTV